MLRPFPLDPCLIPVATDSVGPIGKAYVAVTIGGDARTGVVVRPLVDPNDRPPAIRLVIVRATANHRDRVEPDNVCLAVERQDFVRPVVGGRAR